MKLIDAKAQVEIFYKIHDIIPEKLILYHDFLFMLFYKIETTYFGPEILTKEDDIKNHYLWCYNETVKSFKQEHIYFKTNDECTEYFWLFFYNAFYLSDNKDVKTVINNYLNVLFDYSFNKNDSDMSLLLEIYNIFNKSMTFNKNKVF
jgi:hypothetical protein